MIGAARGRKEEWSCCMKTATTIAVVALLWACASPDKEERVQDLGRAHAAPTASSLAEATPTATVPRVHRGTIRETVDASRYTYLRFETADQKELWAAVVAGKFAVGQPIAIEESIVMKDFHSPSLDRTFPSIIFGGVVDDSATP